MEPARDLDDVPAAVLCARCGAAECAGCEPGTTSGIVQLVPWERDHGGVTQRLWATSKLATFEPESFLGALPQGSVVSAVRFAFLAETVAVLAFSACGLGVLAIAFPQAARALFLDPTYRRLGLGAMPSVISLLVLAHALYGLCLHLGARVSGSSASYTKGARFGLYTAGWDVVHGPIGMVVLGIREGVKGALRAITVGAGLPARAGRALLVQTYRLRDPELTRAYRIALGTLGIALSIATLAVVVLGIWAVFF